MDKDKQRAISGQPFRNVVTPVLYFQCGKCKESMTDTIATEHLKTCQPNGAICGNCGKVIAAVEFVKHIKGCNKTENEREKYQKAKND